MDWQKFYDSPDLGDLEVSDDDFQLWQSMGVPVDKIVDPQLKQRYQAFLKQGYQGPLSGLTKPGP